MAVLLGCGSISLGLDDNPSWMGMLESIEID